MLIDPHFAEEVGGPPAELDWPAELWRPDVTRIRGNDRLTREQERSLHASEQRFRALLDQTSDAVLIADKRGNCVDANPVACKMLGYTRRELLQLNMQDLLAPEQIKRVLHVAEAMYTGDKPRIEILVLHKDGTPLAVEAGARRGVDGLLQILLHEGEELRRAATTTESTEQQFRVLFEQLSDPALILDDQGCVLALNPAAQQLLGLHPANVIGVSLFALLPEARRAVAARLAGHAEPSEVEISSPGEAGCSFEISVTRDFSAGRHLLMLHDVTLRNRTTQLRQAKDAAECASRDKAQFLSRVSHELRTPLNAILGFSELLEMDQLSKEQRVTVDHITSAGRHLLNLINDVLEISRVEAGGLRLEIEALTVEDVVQESVEFVEAMAAARNISIEVDCESMGAVVCGDRVRVRQALLNLLSNAVKYNHEGGKISVNCERRPNGRVRLTVADTGPGISPDQVKSLFAPFERLGAEHTAVEGTGLGLAITRDLVEAMGGEAGVDSTPGVGSAFWIELEAAREV